jgi:hypothetical protein
MVLNSVQLFFEIKVSCLAEDEPLVVPWALLRFHFGDDFFYFGGAAKVHAPMFSTVVGGNIPCWDEGDYSPWPH